MQSFEITVQKPFLTEHTIEYGIIRGNSTVFMIKTGKNGSIYGYENKYLDLAHAIHAKYGYTVLCASNPYEFADSIEQAKEVLRQHIASDFTIVYMGISAGGSVGATYSYNHKEMSKILLINPPLMVNTIKTMRNAEQFHGQCVFVFGSLDPSYKYSELIKTIKSPHVSLEIIEKGDHYLSKHPEQYLLLSEQYLCQ